MPEETSREELERLRVEYEPILIEYLRNFNAETNGLYEQIFTIGKRNSIGDLCLAGGEVIRPIIEGLYGTRTQRRNNVFDFDFIATFTNPEVHHIARGWKQGPDTIYGNRSWRKGNYTAVVNSSATFPVNIPIIKEEGQPTIERVIETAPLNIQQIAAVFAEDDPFSFQLIGDMGILAIRDRIVRLASLEELKYNLRYTAIHEARKKGYGQERAEEFLRMVISNTRQYITNIIRTKAEELGFGADLTIPNNPGLYDEKESLLLWNPEEFIGDFRDFRGIVPREEVIKDLEKDKTWQHKLTSGRHRLISPDDE